MSTTFNITETSSDAVDIDYLDATIKDLDLPGYDGMVFDQDRTGEEIEVFHDALDGTQTANLLAAIQEHDPAKTTTLHCKIYRYLSPQTNWKVYEPPVEVDYRTDLDRRLHPERIFVQGELQQVNYYDDVTVEADGSLTFTDKILTEDYVYVRDVALFAVSRTLTITWYREDDSSHPTTKQMLKFYSAAEKVQEGKRRRGNIVDKLENMVAGYLLATELANNGGDVQATLDMGRDFLKTYKTQIDLFVEGSIQDLYNDILADTTYPWLDNVISAPSTTIRDAITAEINIWGL